MTLVVDGTLNAKTDRQIMSNMIPKALAVHFEPPFKPNGISHCYQLDQSISVFRVFGFYFFYLYCIYFKSSLKANSEEPDQTPPSAASDLVISMFADVT